MGKGKKKKDGLWYKYKTTPYEHQVKALKKLISNKYGGALLMEPRTGKTKVLIDYASILHMAGKVNRVLIFCPVGVMGVWEEEIPKHCPVDYRITLWDKKGRKDTLLPRFGKDVLDFVIVNYDAASVTTDWRRTRKRGAPLDKNGKKPVAWFVKVGDKDQEVWPDPQAFPDEPNNVPPGAYRLRSKSTGGRIAFKKKLLAWQPQLIALDESHRIKSPSAAKSRIIHSLQPVTPYRVIMTGTVVTKKKRIYDVFSQWRFLNPRRFADGIGMEMNFSEFKDHFSVTTTRHGFPQWLRNRNEDELHRLIHEDAFSVLREDCFDLPPLTEQIIPIHLDESAEAYDQMAEDMVARIKSGEVVEASIALVLGLRLRQLSNGIAKTIGTKEHPDGKLRIIGSEKLEVLEDRLTDLMEAGEHVIIGASFRPDIQRIEKLCRKHKWKHWVIMGGVKVPDRRRIVREFNENEEGGIFIGNPAAASEGIDLRTAAIMIWYSLTPSWVHYRQYMDRNALHPGPRFVEYLIASGADELLYETLQEDGDVGKKMITSPERLLRHA